jgi:hypothetical protein
LNEIENDLKELLIDPYANYFIQKFYEYLKLNDRLIFLDKVNRFILIKKFLDKIRFERYC